MILSAIWSISVFTPEPSQYVRCFIKELVASNISQCLAVIRTLFFIILLCMLFAEAITCPILIITEYNVSFAMSIIFLLP